MGFETLDYEERTELKREYAAATRGKRSIHRRDKSFDTFHANVSNVSNFRRAAVSSRIRRRVRASRKTPDHLSSARGLPTSSCDARAHEMAKGLPLPRGFLYRADGAHTQSGSQNICSVAAWSWHPSFRWQWLLPEQDFPGG